MAERIDQSLAKRVPLKAYLSSDHISPGTGLTIAVVISKNGAAFGNPNAGATNATEIGSGWYYVDLDTTDTGTLGPLLVRGTEGTIDPSEVPYTVAAASSAPSAATIADAVWDEALAGHLAAGSTGEALDAAGTGGGDGSTFTDIPWNSDWDAEVQSEVQDALDLMFAAARAEPGQGSPAVNATALAKLDYLYKFMRNKIEQTASETRIYDNAGTTVDHKAPITKTSTLFTRGEFVTGP